MPKYDIAISFAGEQRSLAESFARSLDASGYSVFYDQFEQAELWGRDLSITLGDVYANQARHCLVIVSKEYIEKAWTNLERQNAISRFMKDRSDYILCLRIDDVALPGLPDVVGYITLSDVGYAEAYKLLLRKLGRPDHDHSISHLNEADRAIVKKIISTCYRRAVFTRMASEIDLHAMYSSFGEILGVIQPKISQISDQALQLNALEILSALDEIERIGRQSDARVSNHLEPRSAAAIDREKIRMIDSLLEMRRAANLAIQLPLSLQIDHFFGVESANEAPKIPETEFFPNSDMPLRFDASEQVNERSRNMSVMANVCVEVHDRVLQKEGKPNWHYEEMIMQIVKADIFKDLRSDPLAQLHLGDKLRDLPDTNLTEGINGDEASYIGVRTFPSGSVVGLIGVWPSRGRNAYAIVVDEKFPEYFGLLFMSCDTEKQAESVIKSLNHFSDMRNEEQANALIQNGWQQIIPQEK